MAALKEMLYQKTDIPPPHQWLTFQAKTLCDTKTLASYGVLECNMLHMDCRLLGGGNPGLAFSFADVSREDEDASLNLNINRHTIEPK